MSKPQKLFTLIVVTVALALGAGALLAGCTPEEADATRQEWQQRTVAAMQEAGVDPAEASTDEWKEYGGATLTAMLAEGKEVPAEPAQDWLDFGLNALMSFLGVKGSILGAQAVAAIIRGRRTRGTENLGTLVNPETSWPDTLKALAALTLDTHSPAAAAPAPGPGPTP